MTIRTSQELKHAEGVVQRRQQVAESIGNSDSKSQALYAHGEVCGAVREVAKHRDNILGDIDNEGAGHAIRVNELHDITLEWLSRSRGALTGWGVSASELRSMEEAKGVKTWV